MSVRRNEAELELVKVKKFRRVCNAEMFSTANEATMLMVDLKSTQYVLFKSTSVLRIRLLTCKYTASGRSIEEN